MGWLELILLPPIKLNEWKPCLSRPQELKRSTADGNCQEIHSSQKLQVALSLLATSNLGNRYLATEDVMAERKQFRNVNPPDPELIRLLDEARSKSVTEEELQEQRISFAFGNALESESITKDSVRLASKHIRLRR
jgi:hypothetical protein